MRILVVDDEPDLELLVRQKFRRRIRAGEMEFSFAGDGVLALERVESDPDLDIVLSDINMPRMDGLTLLTRLADLELPLKTVIVSAYGDMDNIRTAMNRGAFDFVTKPINFEDLETTIDKTWKDVRALRDAEQSKKELDELNKELDVARTIQASALPSTFPAFPERNEFELYATMQPARVVGGDFYDFFLIDDNRLGFLVGDVSGKGLGAAMFMSAARSIMRATAMRGENPAACLTHANRVLYPESMRHMFVTAFYCVLDTSTGQVTYCNAGHNPPFILRSDGPSMLQPVRGLGMCLAHDYKYESGTFDLAPGDSVLLYTDGVTEAMDGKRNLFAEERLERTLSESDHSTAQQIVESTLRAVMEFAAGESQRDDITALSVVYNGG